MPKIEPYAAPGVYDPPMYSQAVKVTGTETILFIAGQVAYGPQGTPMHAGDFKAQARAALQCLKSHVPGCPWHPWSGTASLRWPSD
jgi:enamine deaminase RidA (YjgF/YER057c/UK114 family)